MDRGHASRPGSDGLSGEHLSITSAIRLPVLRNPYACRIATLILLFTASTRAFETPSAMDLTMPSALRRTLRESSTNCGTRLRHAHDSHLASPSRASASDPALKTALKASLSR